MVNKFKDCTSAYDVAGVLEANKATGGFSEAFAEIVSKHLTGTPAEASGKDSVTINNLTPGYYFVKDADGSLNGANGAYTRFIMKLLSGTETATAKSDLPTLDKVINEDGGIDANTASIGDNVEFKLTSKVPDMTGYNKYFFVVNDKLSEGFTFNDDVKIKIGDSELADTAFYVTDLGGGEIKIVINDFINYQSPKNQTIEITYSAELDENANLGTEGNTNVANLVYSNNPNYEYQGDPSKPNEPYTPEDGTPDNPDTPNFDESKPDPTGDTPEIKTVTYATTLQIIKVDGDNTNTKLPGAKFKLEKKNSEGNYVQVGELITTGTDGLATFAGLGEGIYRITEEEPPTNYNGLTGSIEVTLDATATVTNVTWSKQDGPDDLVFEDNTFKITIENNKGSSLPTTGGMGTTLIYVLGGMLVLCSIVLIITRKRMEYRQF
ncbi:MAG: isopeptide-forming domain-containing fimbrial protein [Oscillospiraceae bacterium]|nr:isopeptide-forming domain-containing fimbrial protein [Oscillospiraceae bacterium]